MGNTQNFVNEKVPKLLISNKVSRYNGRCQDTETRSCLVTSFEEKINVVGIRIFLVPTLLAMTSWKSDNIFLAADSSSSSPKVVVCCLSVCDQVRKLLANCLLTAC